MRTVPILRLLGLGWVGLGSLAAAVFQTAPGRFEITAVDAAVAAQVAEAADSAWRHLAAPLALPAGFSSPVFVRVVPSVDWRESAAFRVLAEPGGIVSLRMGWPEPGPPPWLDRALVQALLLRLGVARQGVTEGLAVPLWLELGCAGWWRAQSEGARLDLLKHESRASGAPRVADLLARPRGGVEPAGWAQGATWLVYFLLGESPKGEEWTGLLRRLLRGDDSGAALAAAYPGRFADPGERELWWLTGYHQLRRGRTGPQLEAAESAAALGALQRFVVVRDGREVVLPLPEVLAHAPEPFLATALDGRAAELARLLPVLHPFYRNAGLALSDLLAARATPARHGELLSAWTRDWSDAVELAAESTRVLDRWEATLSARPSPR